jgi:L-iditol 2-dehydrogenase
MQALLLREYKHFEMVEQPVPQPADDEVLIEVKATGICGSDVHGMDGSTGRRVPPVVMGHESAGVIAQVGAAVSQWKVGDRVTFDSTIYCSQCDYCLEGRVNLCDDRRVLGVSCGDYNQPGAFAEHLSVPARILYQLPDTMSFHQAAFCEPASVALHAVNRMPVNSGDSAVVVGTGIIGLLVVQALKAAGCGQVIAIDLDPFKLKMAKQLGADVGLVPSEDTVEKVHGLTGGQGVNLAMEVVGLSVTTNLAVNVLRKGGSLGCVGNLAQKIDFPLQAVVTRELSLFGSCAIKNEYTQAIEYISNGTIVVDPMISAVAPLNEGAEWFARLYENKEDLLKVILEP